jgi:hypothetical protein
MNNDDTPIQATEPAERSGLPKEEVLAQLRARLMQSAYPTIKQEYGSPQRGVETGLDEAFVIDRATYESLIKADPQSAAILNPFAHARDINRWRAGSDEAWLINTVPGTVNIDEYPAVRDYLAPFKERLEKRETAGQWFELAQADHLDAKQMADLKIVYRANSNWPGGFTLDRSGAYHASSSFHVPNGDYYVSGLLNSKVYWFLLDGMSPANPEGVMALQPEHVESLPVPRMVDVNLFSMVGSISDFCHRTLDERKYLYEHVNQEIANFLAPGRTVTELNPAMRNWHMLTVDSLREEARRHFGKDIQEDMVQTWEDFLNEAQFQLNQMNTDMSRSERKLDMAVYKIFELTEEEIEYLDKY